ncbi:MAG: methylmalonyl-CoA mutase family protein, partial [Chloroflexota bacterium]|nr:methylmalonyl-CoA mutase family protein [Chloroflexota bacterium]
MPSSDKEQWKRETLDPVVKRFPERRDNFQTDSGLVIGSLYSPEDLHTQGLDYDNDLGYPGEFPYTRGVQPNTYRGRVWTMRQYSGY